MRFRSLLVVLLVIAAALSGPYLVREASHWRHYRQLEQRGEYKAKILELNVPASTKSGTPVKCLVAIRNTGTQPWLEGVQYFALGVYDQDKGKGRFAIRTVKPKLPADDAIGDRLIVHNDIYPEMVWAPSFELVLPAEPGEYRVHFQMVQEGATWFGEMKEVMVRVE